MSTKIYYAWRVPLRQLELFTQRLHAHMFRRAKDQFGKITGIFGTDYLESRVRSIYRKGGWAKHTPFDKFLPKWIKVLRVRSALAIAYQQSKSKTRTPGIDLDCAFHVWIMGRFAYIIPSGEHYLHQSFRTPCGKKYGYWNNTDQPDRVTNREWATRRRIWDKVLGDYDKARLTHTVIDIKADVGCYALARGVLGKDDSTTAVFGIYDDELAAMKRFKKAREKNGIKQE